MAITALLAPDNRTSVQYTGSFQRLNTSSRVACQPFASGCRKIVQTAYGFSALNLSARSRHVHRNARIPGADSSADHIHPATLELHAHVINACKVCMPVPSILAAQKSTSRAQEKGGVA